MSSLIVYYSRSGETYIAGTVQKLETGISERTAQILCDVTGAERFRLEPLIPEPKDLSDYINQVMGDYQRQARPELNEYPDLTEIDTLYLVFPNFFKTMPMPVYSFLERNTLTDKTIYVFVTHGGDGFGDSLKQVKKYTETCDVQEGLCIRDTEIGQAEEQIRAWWNDKGRN